MKMIQTPPIKPPQQVFDHVCTVITTADKPLQQVNLFEIPLG